MENEASFIKISRTGYFLATMLRGACVTRFYASCRDPVDDEIPHFARYMFMALRWQRINEDERADGGLRLGKLCRLTEIAFLVRSFTLPFLRPSLSLVLSLSCPFAARFIAAEFIQRGVFSHFSPQQLRGYLHRCQ